MTGEQQIAESIEIVLLEGRGSEQNACILGDDMGCSSPRNLIQAGRFEHRKSGFAQRLNSA